MGTRDYLSNARGTLYRNTTLELCMPPEQPGFGSQLDLGSNTKMAVYCSVTLLKLLSIAEQIPSSLK